ncbi:hypothetical protein ACIQNG_24610 [Streptomyces sp. NPDC091377]|uniref:hypothetical protein n=1 Tax=Streptomyces sp. NPDC091377 TaxID=3365995 RepID=UPI003800362B
MSGKNVAAERQTPQLSVGDLVFDTARRVLGVLMDTGEDMGEGLCFLRPPRGGIEWTVSPADIRPATVADQLRPALAEMNERSSGGAP